MKSTWVVKGKTLLSNAPWQRWQAPAVAKSANTQPSANRQTAVAVTAASSMMSATELEEIRQQARAEAWQQGLAEGRAAGQAELDKTALRWRQIMSELSQPLLDSSQQVGDELTLLALAIAKQVIRSELKTQPKQIVDLVQDAIKALPSAAKSIQVVLHPDDARIVKSALRSESDTAWRIEEDRHLSLGGCVVKSDIARIDERVETRIERVVATLFGASHD